MRARELDESELVARMTAVLPGGERTLLGPGDDCAWVAAPEGSFLVTTDVLVAGEHFILGWSEPDEIGARAAAQNLADVAAMGARPSSVVVSLVIPGDTDVDWLVDLVAGFAQRCSEVGAAVVGGDISAGPVLVIAVTAHGWVEGAPITRTGARGGDTLAIAGTLGQSGAGLELLSRGLVDPRLHSDLVLGEVADVVRTYRAPRPPLEAGPIAHQHGATAMLDISDGLVRDAGRLAAASGVMVEIDREALRPDADALTAAGELAGTDPLQWALYGGEDHGLLATFPPHVLVPSPFRVIGSTGSVPPTQSPGVRLDGQPITGGWDHFRR